MQSLLSEIVPLINWFYIWKICLLYLSHCVSCIAINHWPLRVCSVHNHWLVVDGLDSYIQHYESLRSILRCLYIPPCIHSKRNVDIWKPTVIYSLIYFFISLTISLFCRADGLVITWPYSGLKCNSQGQYSTVSFLSSPNKPFNNILRL